MTEYTGWYRLQHTEWYDQNPSQAIEVEAAVEHFLECVRSRRLRHVQEIEDTYPLKRETLNRMVCRGVLSGTKRLALCKDGQRRWVYFLNPKEVEMYLALSPSEKRAVNSGDIDLREITYAKRLSSH